MNINRVSPNYIIIDETNDFIKVIVPSDYNPINIEELRFFLKKDVKIEILQKEKFNKLLQKKLSEEVPREIKSKSLKEEVTTDLLKTFGDNTTVRLVNQILIKAINAGASDIHFEPYVHEVLVRLRLDGVLTNYITIPPSKYSEIVSRIKVMANLNIAEKRIPQDGKFSVKVADKDYDIRVSTIPTIFGERIVLRILDRSKGLLTLKDIGLTQENLRKIEQMLSKPYGILLVTGPTGAGKTTTLYAMLSQLKNPRKNIITIEDPVEYQINGISQIQINPKVGLTFAKGLRAILRQDPDVIMVGEIRDSETAQIAIQAALTGHLVLSTLHTNDAPSAVTRLRDMGAEPFLIASALEGIIAQRLVRKICPYCKEPYKPSKEELQKFSLNPEGDYIFYKGKGCKHCLGTGYKGRTAIFEILVIDEEMKRFIMKTQDANELKAFALKKGFKPIIQDGLEKILKGITTSEEVLSVI